MKQIELIPCASHVIYSKQMPLNNLFRKARDYKQITVVFDMQKKISLVSAHPYTDNFP